MTADRVLARRGFLRWAVPVLVLTLAWAAWNAWDFIEGRRLKDAVDAIRRSGAPTSLAELEPQLSMGRQSPDDAAPYYAAAAALADIDASSADSAAASRIVVAVAKGDEPRSDDLARMPDLFEQRADALRLLDAATSRTFDGFPTGTSYGYRRAEFMRLFLLSGARTIAAAATHDSTRATTSLVAEIRLVLGPTPPARGWLGPLFVPTVSQIVARVRWLVERSAPDDASLAALAGAFARADDDGALDRQFQKDRAFELESFARQYGSVYGGSRLFGVAPAFTALWTTTSRPIETRTLLHRLAYYDTLLAASRSPWPARLDRIGALNARPFGDYLPAETATAAAQTLALVRAARIVVAVERFRAANARALPTSTDALVPTYLPAAPIDPYSGQPMRYHAQPSGYVIYSVGPDRKDDGGDMKTDVSVQIAPTTARASR